MNCTVVIFYVSQNKGCHKNVLYCYRKSFVACIHFVVLSKRLRRQMIILHRESDKTRSTGSLIIIILSIFSSCTIGIVTMMSDREYRKPLGGGWVASSGACPAPVSLACFYHSSVLFACVCVWCRSQWKRLARRPLIWPCKVSGARLMKTLFYTYISYTG